MFLLLGARNWIPVGELGGSRPDPGASAVDPDGDGLPRADDCDDDDETVNPDAEETAWNGADDDCDGDADCEDSELLNGQWEGDVPKADVADFCDGYCTRTVT